MDETNKIVDDNFDEHIKIKDDNFEMFISTLIQKIDDDLNFFY